MKSCWRKRTWMTNQELAAIRLLVAAHRPVPCDLAALLLAERDVWVKDALDLMEEYQHVCR